MRVIDDFINNATPGLSTEWITTAMLTRLKEYSKIFDVSELFDYFDSTDVSHVIPITPPFEQTTLTINKYGMSVLIQIATNYETHQITVHVFRKQDIWCYIGDIIAQALDDWTPSSEDWYSHDIPSLDDKNTTEMQEFCRMVAKRCTQIAAQTFQLLNCKNVSTIEHDGLEHLKPKVRERFIRSGKPMPIKHYTLAVTVPGEKRVIPFKQLIEEEQHESRQALHTCRGHFATYTPERKLFGRLTGSFWIPAHFKGLPKNGVITKDYKLKPR